MNFVFLFCCYWFLIGVSAFVSRSNLHIMAGFNWADDTHDNEALAPVFNDDRLPPRQESIDPSTGVRTVIEYHINDKGERVKTTRKFRAVRRQHRVHKNVARRRNIEQFGDVYGATEADQRNVTYQAYDEIFLNLSAGNDDDDGADDPLNKLQTQKSIVVCRLCGAVGDHWTLKCPKRNGPAGNSAKKGDDDAAAKSQEAPANTSGRYVAPSLRQGANRGPSRMGDRDDMPTIRVTNLSEDTTEQDLGELLSPFGHVTRIRLAKDRVTNYSKGYAFISFTKRSDAQRAIDKLNGYGYDNLILSVEWSRSMQQLMREREAREAAEAAKSQ